MTKRRSAADRVSIYLSNKFDNVEREQSVQRTIVTVNALVVRLSAFLMALGIVWGLAPHVETQWFGVIQEWRAENIEQMPDGNWRMDVYGTKPWYRGNCEYMPGQSITALVITGENSAYRGTLRNLSNPNPTTRPSTPVEQFFGRWELTSQPAAPEGSQVIGRVRHDCDFPWLTITNVGPFVLDPSSNTQAVE